MNFQKRIIPAVIGACLMLTAFSANALTRSDKTVHYGSDIGFKGWGPRLAFVDPEGPFAGTAEVGVVFDFGEFIPQLRWDGSISAWSSGRRYQYYNNNRYENYDWTVRDFILRTGVNYRLIEGAWVPYVGGGIGVHFYSWDYNRSPYYSNSSESKIGIYLDGGIEHQFSDSWKGQMQLQGDTGDFDQTSLIFSLIYRIE